MKLYLYNEHQNVKSKNRTFIKIIVVVFTALIIFSIGMYLGQYYENRPANKDQVANLANEVYELDNPVLMEELTEFRKRYPSPSQNQLDAFRDFLKLRKETPKPTIALPELESKNTAEGVKVNTPGTDYQSLSVSATALKIGQFVMDANNCIYVVQNSENTLKVVPALDMQSKQYCPAKK